MTTPKADESRTMSVGDLVTEFESLGDNCEFGLVQRFCGVEPLGLFRFSFSRIDNLIRALDADLEGFGDPDDLEIFVRAGEYNGCSRRYQDFAYHTGVMEHRDTVERITRREAGKLAYLRDRLLADLSTAEKIFIRKGRESDAEIAALVDGLRRHGPNWLLQVVVDESGTGPRVERVREGLVKASIPRFSQYHEAFRVDLESWIEICRQALLLVDELRGRTSRTLETSANRVLATGEGWQVSDVCRDAPIEDATELVLAVETARIAAARRTITLPDVPRRFLVASTWVFIPEAFTGTRLELSIDETSLSFCYQADLRTRNRWQRIWASARLGKDQVEVRLSLLVAGARDDRFRLAGWQVEDGIVPNAEDFRIASALPATSLRDRMRSASGRALRRLAPWLEPRGSAAALAQIAPGSAAATAFLDAAAALRRELRESEADAVLSRAVAAFPDDPRILRAFALNAHESARYRMAIPRWTALLQVAPDDPMGHAGLAANLREIGDLEAAAAQVVLGRLRCPDDLVLLTEAARVAAARADPGTALALWDEALRRSPPYPEWMRARVEALIGLGRVDEAGIALGEARAVFPGSQALADAETLVAAARARNA